MTDHITSAGERIAFRKQDGKGAGIVYAGGHKTVMTGGRKCTPIGAWCSKNDVPFVCFDYAGWGGSGDDNREWECDTWAENLVDVLDQIVDFPAVLVGNSMGGYLMLLAALARPEKVRGLVGIAPGFGDYIQATGREDISYKPDNITISLALENDPAARHVMTRQLEIICPFRSIHSRQDELVDWRASVNIMDRLATEDAALRLVKDGNHSMARTQDVQIAIELLEELL